MSLTLTITDDTTSETYTVLPSPFTKSRVMGKSEVTTQSGDVYTDYVYKKFEFEYKWKFLSEAEYAVLEGFFNRQFSLNKYPRITIPSLGVEDMVVRMELGDQDIINNCGMVQNVKVSFRETTQL